MKKTINNNSFILKQETNNYIRFHSNSYIRICRFLWGGDIWMKVNHEYNGKGIWNQKKSSLSPSTNDFTSYGPSPMLISSVAFT